MYIFSQNKKDFVIKQQNLFLFTFNLYFNILEPEVICIGGSFAHYKEILLERLEKKLDEKIDLYNKGNIPKIVFAELKNDAGIIGAAMQF